MTVGAGPLESDRTRGREPLGTRGSRRRWRVSLRNVLFVAFLLIAVIPVGLLAVWLERDAYQKEVAEVSERHLLIAHNLSLALNRYAQDTEAVFAKSVQELTMGQADSGLGNLLRTMGFKHVCIIRADGSLERSVERQGGPNSHAMPDHVPIARIATAAGGKAVFTGVLPNGEGQPALYLTRQLDDGRIAIGELDMGYVMGLQKAIAFGEKGHSAIVDHQGRVLAHPSEAWRLERKDISKITAVQRMIAGETGVATFYSPALDDDMIAGFTTVPHTGWGVMVPQPLSELKAHADQVRDLTLSIGGLGFLVALALAWFVSRQLALPIERIAAVARAVRAGDHNARVLGFSGAPHEVGSLAAAINRMLGELGRSNERLREKAREAQAANEAKTRFLANMSHEFRTPLSAIIGYSEIMRDELHGPLGGNGEYKEYIGSVHAGGAHILQMVNEILLLTRAEAGRLEMHRSEVKIDDAVAFALSMIEHSAREAGVTVQPQIAADLPVLLSDDGKFRQVLLNLLSNAVKFTDRGGRIDIEATESPDGGVRVVIRDTGIGISKADMQKIMRPFGQVEDAYDRNHGGTGLGLPLTRELVTFLGGKFHLKSVQGEGTVAEVLLPREAPLDDAGN